MPFNWGGLIGGLLGGAAGYVGQREANVTNRDIASNATIHNVQQARENRNWQETMSNSAYQRQVKGMKAAGLNPMLAIMKGGASTPGGAQGAAVTAHMENELGKGVTSGVELTRAKKEVEGMNSTVKLNNAIGDTQRALKEKAVTSAKNNAAQTKILDAQLKSVKSGAKLQDSRNVIDQLMLVPDATMKRLSEAKGLINPLKNLIKRRKKPSYLNKKTGELFKNRDIKLWRD